MSITCRSLANVPVDRPARLPGRYAARAVVLIAAIVLQGLAVGCGGGGGSNTNSQSPPSGLVYPQTSIAATVGTAIATDTPTVTGSVAGYAISPDLPAGLSISSSTGAISGTPTAASAKTSYTITASNSSGSTTAAVSITVVISAPSGLAYPQTSISATVGTAIATDTPTVTGSVASYTISPALPAGLAISSSTGVISGTPTAASPKTKYTVTASNSTGSTKAAVSIAVLIPAPSGLLYPQTSISAIVGTAIVTDVPTVTGSVASYSISPALPAGLALSSSTGVISGKPTAASAKTSYTVTASNSTGSTKAAVSIAVLIPAPSNLAYPEMSISATVGTAIATDTPTVTGTVSSYTISPALPAGLAISSSTGAISGKPTAATAEASYTVTASNSSGHTTTAVSIAVLIPAPSNLVYPQTSILAAVGAAIATDTPTVTGAVSSYTILPALPPGLAIVPSTGVISGTPTAASPKTTYTVKASNSTGSTTAQVTITVASATSILELGHGGGIMSIRATADSVLSIDWTGHWNLWSYSSGKELSSGDSGTEYVEGSSPNSTDNIGLAGDLAVAPLPSGLGVYSASTGQQIFVVPSGSAGIAWFSLATDGSYLCTGSSSGLTVWSPSGSQEFTRPGNYQSAEAFAAPGQVQVALGPAGAGVIETDSVPTGTSTTSASFSGTFNSWFVDGQRFLTNLGDTVWVYSAARVQQSIMSLPGIQNLTGQGDWIWSTTAGASLSVYAIGNATPVATYTLGGTTTDLPVATGSTLAILHVQMPAVTVIDLSGATPSATNYNLPAPLSVLSAFGAYSSSQWVVGNQNGVLLDGATASSATPRYFDYGAVFSIAGSSNNIAIATAIGEILLFDPTGATQQGAIDFLSGQLELSSDGSVLAAGAYAGFSQYLPDRTLNIYSLPSQAITQTFPYTFNLSGTPVLGDFSLSASGQTLGQVLESDDGSWPLSYSREVTPTSGSPITWSDTGIDGSLVLSPDGTNLAAANEYTPTPTATPSTANLWTNGALVTAIVAQPEGWIDNSHLLAANYTATNINSSIFVAYAGSTIYDPAGDVVATVPGTSFPAMPNPDFTSNGLVYDWVSNAVYSLATGAPVWNGPANKIVNTETAPIPLGALTGSNVVYVYGHQVFIAPY